jgi:ABC-type polysaccharide/polyol phosphate transport system ATPase subunit
MTTARIAAMYGCSTKPRLLAVPGEEREVVIRLEGVSVRYRVPHERIGTLKEYAIRALQRRVRNDDFWALRDVNLEVHGGEALGIIGRNGAGKSTLLKVVARVLRPTHGRVWIRGRVAPLLEFQAGFHPELSGRENVYLNGCLLGSSRREMASKLPRIVGFAELEEFIDAPVRTYSSGMVARLGFSIATDVQPDILIVDEVLSVGDEGFRRKSTKRMQSFREAGTTILLVTHNLEAMQAMCTRAIWLEQGVVKAAGSPGEVAEAYLMGQGEKA